MTVVARPLDSRAIHTQTEFAEYSDMVEYCADHPQQGPWLVDRYQDGEEWWATYSRNKDGQVIARFFGPLMQRALHIARKFVEAEIAPATDEPADESKI